MNDNNLIRIGKISSFNYPKGTARITYEDKGQSTTVEMPFLCNAWQYWMPRVGDQVLVVHLSNGSCAAMILGPIWHDGHRPPEGFEGLYRKEYSNHEGMAYERYDANVPIYNEWITGTAEIEATEKYQITVGASQIIMKPDSITITTPKLDIVVDDTITETAGTSITVNAGVSVSTSAGVSISEEAGSSISESAGDTITENANTITQTAGSAIADVAPSVGHVLI